MTNPIVSPSDLILFQSATAFANVHLVAAPGKRTALRDVYEGFVTFCEQLGMPDSREVPHIVTFTNWVKTMFPLEGFRGICCLLDVDYITAEELIKEYLDANLGKKNDKNKPRVSDVLHNYSAWYTQRMVFGTNDLARERLTPLLCDNFNFTKSLVCRQDTEKKCTEETLEKGLCTYNPYADKPL